MNRIVIAIAVATRLTMVQAQADSTWLRDLSAYWEHLEAEFADSATSPLIVAEQAHFVGLQRFAPDASYCVLATFTPAAIDVQAFAMRTTRTRTPLYKPFGTLHFRLNDGDRVLTVYQRVPPHSGYENEVFLPFTDLTNGEETYGVGRYIDLHGPLDSTLMLDFNRAYNPYCAYNDRYSCPVPPASNHLRTAVRAGVLKFHD